MSDSVSTEVLVTDASSSVVEVLENTFVSIVEKSLTSLIIRDKLTKTQINLTPELIEIVKKLLFQGKPLTEENLFHMKRELGDIMWYWVNACRALNLDPNDVIAENVRKLEARYPGGHFDAFHSENRLQGDL